MSMDGVSMSSGYGQVQASKPYMAAAGLGQSQRPSTSTPGFGSYSDAAAYGAFSAVRSSESHASADIIERYVGSAERWGARLTIAEMAQRVLDGTAPKPSAIPATGWQQYLDDVAKNSVSYRDMLGIGNQTAKTSEVFVKGGWQVYKKAVRANFASALQPNAITREMTLGRYVKQTLGAYNVRHMATAVSTGKNVAIGIGQAVGLAFPIADTVLKTRDTYLASVKEGDSPTTTAVKTGGAFVWQGMKNLACWELSTIGYAVGFGLGVGFWPATIAGVLTGTMFALGGRLGLEGIEKGVQSIISPTEKPNA
jgi:hypothetical protein